MTVWWSRRGPAREEVVGLFDWQRIVKMETALMKMAQAIEDIRADIRAWAGRGRLVLTPYSLAAGEVRQIAPANLRRAAWEVRVISGGPAYLYVTHTRGLQQGIPVTTTTPFRDPWPVVYQGEWYVEVTAATVLVVAEWEVQR